MGDFVLYLSTFALSALGTRTRKYVRKHKLLYYILILFFPVLIATLRKNVGTDYESYYWGYMAINKGMNTTFEILFVWLNRIANFVFHDFYGVLLFSAVITYGCILIALEKLESDTSVGIALWIFYCFYFSASLNVMRQMIAVSIIFLATVYLNEENYKVFFALVAIAALFHMSALVAVIFLLIKWISKKDYKIMIALTVVLSCVFMFLSEAVLKLLPSFIVQKYGYAIQSMNTMGLSYLIDIIPTYLIMILPVLYYLFFCRDNNKYDFYCCSAAFCLPMLILGSQIKYFQRIVFYFDISQIVIVPLLLRKTRSATTRFVLKILFVLFYAFFFWYSSIFRMSNEIVPYVCMLIG